jgi:hypothetical protein
MQFRVQLLSPRKTSFEIVNFIFIIDTLKAGGKHLGGITLLTHTQAIDAWALPARAHQ